jgi:hypothetical protein
VKVLGLAAATVLVIGIIPGPASADPDPRIGLGAGWLDAQSAISNLQMVSHLDKPDGFVNPANPGDFAFVTSDLAFRGNHVFMGNYNGFNIVDISDPAHPAITTSVVCPGGQGDLSVVGDLLFMSVEQSRGRVDCGTDPNVGIRFQGVRVFDISDLANPVQVAAVQLCRGSHTHSVVTDPDDPSNVYIYVSGTTGVRPESTLAGCNNNPAAGENPSRWRIDVIKVPVANPEQAMVVNQPRLFADPQSGAVDGLQNAPQTPTHPSGGPWGPTPITDACHDITALPALGIAAGACEGNGILIDISDPANPARLDAVSDPGFAYWHSATFSNDGKKVLFTDEWGGGTGPRCRETDRPEWGANAIFNIVDGKMEFASYYKLPVPQTLQENCVAHNGSVIPVPGRDIMVQAWYQGGISLMDFTDAANPREIGYFDRGPVSATALVAGGFWSAYWYNGQIYASELARGFDALKLQPSEHLTAAEIAAAGEVRLAEFNAQHQPKLTWAPSFAVARARFDQLRRTCTTTITGRRNGPLIASGVTCLDGATVNGPILVGQGASLLSINSGVNGPVAAQSAGAVQLYHSNISGPVLISGAQGSAAIVDSTVRGPVVVNGTGTPGIEPIIADSTINGPLVCSGNAPAPINLGAPNTVRGPATGQCAALD